MSQHHLNSTKESAVFSFFMFSFPWFYAWGKRQALNFPIFFRWALHFSLPPPSSPFNLPYLMQHYLLNLAKLCIITYSESLITPVSKLKLSFCLPFCCYLHSFVFSAVYPVNFFSPFTLECWGSFFSSYVCLFSFSSAIRFLYFHSFLESVSHQAL